MTHTQPETHAEARLSGRELARQRRKAMASQGKRAVKPARQAAAHVAAASGGQVLAKKSAPTAASVAPTGPSGRMLARSRREAMARNGKAALPNARSSGRPVRAARSEPAGAKNCAEACSCGCKGAREDALTVDTGQSAERRVAMASEATSLTPKEIAARLVKNQVHGSGRDIALARRKALGQEGKAGLKRAAQATKIAKYLPEKDWRVAIAKGVTGRQVAMQRRKVRALAGRGETGQSADETRKSASRRTARALAAPPKVEQGHTLSGQEVTGTMVERARQVTGNESGSCRSVTGTEYIGLEQFDAFCQARPEANPAKVTLSRTLHGRSVSGTEVAPDDSVTGAESGACREVTGTQYLSADHFERFCPTRPQPPASKVGMTRTQKDQALTGTMVLSESRVTGGEAGAGRDITGTGYARAKAPKPAAEKVAVMHTASGGQVTGTTVGRSEHVTGNEPGTCRVVSGTEYLSSEQYAAFCENSPPRPPRKVSIMSTPAEQPVTGTSVSRDAKVTGNEPGSCRAVTGTPYFNSRDFGDVCASNGPAKVGAAATRAGTQVSGTEVRSNPKMTGDEEGRCTLVTGTDYVGAQDLRAVCVEGTPPDQAVTKVAVDRTWQGETITGAAVGRAAKMTGDEYGGCAPISGTPYIGQGQYVQFCEPREAEAQLARVPTRGIVSAADITGDRPGAGGSVMTGDERGACEPVTGTPYVGPDNLSAECAIGGVGSGRFVGSRREVAEPPRPSAPRDFSIVPPARQACEERRGQAVTGAQINSDRITGSANRAQGLITGTPEFRHRDIDSRAAETEAASVKLHNRPSDEASPRNLQITGDTWSAQQREKVTGTEGHFSVMRNPTQRGNPRGAGRNAQGHRDVERPEVPESPVTGSAGATMRGAVVTVSRGARG
ncbi:hypothetical protein BI364_01515 [Acidihalobacter yilgarnensis]|uniref:Carboxysome shell protein CsoS2 n=1 Tax=Acidihalobacter yilgarnensis TaxID=2819280 RepID=A0A1D8IK62_9GAMM|nr:CsoS2 family carboxysome shell protein [Acidihalobacter yilgarnensis]AOU96859.1 hypothetical protein BI364_01515 [Acidihalobacter yilgarnensis]